MYNRTGRKILVGLNYPWADYGADFGIPPPGKTRAPWKAAAKLAELRELKRKYGIFAVRWFILADGLTYGTGAEAPGNPSGNIWTFQVPAHSPNHIVSDFKTLLVEIHQAGLKIIPSLIDFHWCHPGKPVGHGYVKCGRADVIRNAANHRKFFEHILEPLLKASKGLPIYAWELVNEPEWITIGSGQGDPSKHVIPMPTMNAFIREGIRRINAAGFDSTVGFAKMETLAEQSPWDWKSSKITKHQFHYYPLSHLKPTELPEHWFSVEYPCFVGEFATVLDMPEVDYKTQPPTYKGPDGKKDWTWLLHDSVSQRLLDMEAKGYPAAFLWSKKPKDPKWSQPGGPDDPATNWDTNTKNEIKKVTGMP